MNVDEYGRYNQHKHTITDLTPGTKYKYKVRCNLRAREGTFYTSPPNGETDVKFLVVGDAYVRDKTEAEKINPFLISMLNFLRTKLAWLYEWPYIAIDDVTKFDISKGMRMAYKEDQALQTFLLNLGNWSRSSDKEKSWD